jgi:hypothetical protein
MGGPQGSNEQTELVDDDVDDLRGIRRTEKLKLFFETGEGSDCIITEFEAASWRAVCLPPGYFAAAV